MKPEIETIIVNMFPEYKELPNDDLKDDFWSDLSEQEKYNVNKEYLLQLGNPEHDYLVCWEPGRLDDENESLFDYPTFYELDKSWWEFQKQASWESIEESKKWMEQGSTHHTPERVAKSINSWEDRYREYDIEMTGDWFRLMEDDTFVYCQMISLKWYLYSETELLADELIEEHIPWSFKGDKDNWLNAINSSDPKESYDAGGREYELERLKTLVREYTNKTLLDKIQTIIDKYPNSGKTFRFDRGYGDAGEKFDPFTDFIFYDIQSLKNVRTTNFLEDFKDNEVDNVVVTIMLNDLREIVTDDFMRMYNENRSRYIQK